MNLSAGAAGESSSSHPAAPATDALAVPERAATDRCHLGSARLHDPPGIASPVSLRVVLLI
jgi:hypothetical protein